MTLCVAVCTGLFHTVGKVSQLGSQYVAVGLGPVFVKKNSSLNCFEACNVRTCRRTLCILGYKGHNSKVIVRPNMDKKTIGVIHVYLVIFCYGLLNAAYDLASVS